MDAPDAPAAPDPPVVWARGRLTAGEGRTVSLDVDGHVIDCVVPADDTEPGGATAFGLLAASLSACTAMSVRTFLERWHVAADAVQVDVGLESGPSPVLHRHVAVRADLGVDARGQLAGVVDATPITVLLRDALVIVTRLDVGARQDG